MTMNRRSFHRLALAGAATWLAGNAGAQGFPDKPVKLLVGAPAGGTSDVVARMLGAGLSPLLGQPVLVDNKPGAAGVLAVQELLKSPRDGHTLLVAPNGVVSEIPHALKLPLDPMKELRPLVELARTGLLVGAPNVPAANLKEVIAHVKANPGKISYASYSPGTLSHTLGLEFNRLAGTDLTHVGYRGSPPALNDVMAGHVAYMFDGPATSIPLIKAGKIKVFATTAPTRLAMLPDVPTFAELGFPSLTETAWMGVFLPADIPAPAQARLREAVLKAAADPSLRERFAALGLEMVTSPSSQELMASLRAASDRQAAALKVVGFKPE